MNQDALERLQSKTATEALIGQIQQDFNLSPMVARTLLEQLHHYKEDYSVPRQTAGQLRYLAVSQESPAGQPLDECERVPILLTFHSEEDLIALGQGVSVLRQQRLLRWTEEAYDQGALLTHEDLAYLLCSSLATMKRDVAALRREGLHVPTRGQVKDIGKGVSHKSQIVQDYLNGYTFSEIKLRRRHSINAIRRYCQDFVRIVRLAEKGLTVLQIRQATRLSERLIGEYLVLYESCNRQGERFQLLMADPNPATDTPAEIKRGALLR